MPTQELQASTSNVADSVQQGGGGDASGYQAAGQVVAMAGDAVTASSVTDKGKTTGQIASGAGKGAASGAAIGTMILPGIGTAIGAGLGAIAGGISGGVKQKKANEAASDQRMADTQALANQYQAKYGSFARYYNGGATIPTQQDGFNPTPNNTTQLPGGVQMPIGFGVDKFVGNKHDQAGMGSPSGIILEEGGKSKPGIEVEDGELQTDVKTKGGKKEYIVSDYIVNPATGNTLAEDMEKEIKAAKSKKQADQIKQKYVKLNEELKEDGKPEMVKAQDGSYTAMSAEDAKVGKQKDMGEGFFGEATAESLEELKKRNPWYDFSDFDPNDPESVKDFQKEYNKRAPEDQQVVVDGRYGTQTDSIDMKKAEGKPEEKPEDKPAGSSEEEETLDIEEIELEEENIDDDLFEDKSTEKKDDTDGDDGESIRLRPTGTMIQALGPLAQLNESFTPQKVRPEYIDAPTLRRENYERERSEERAGLAASNEAASRAMSGPAAFAARQSAAAQSANRQRQITSAEGRANRQIADQEKRLQMAADQANVNAFMRADAQNVAASNQAAMYNQENRIAAINQLGKIGTQTVVDRNQQRADIFAGQAGQVDGEFDRALQNFYPSSRLPFGPKINIKPEGGTTLSPDQISLAYQQSLIDAKAAENEVSRRGGYIKGKKKVRRNRKKK
tara:strand:- start:2508 stop:4532 length:2025 start_codon:yes stop_codon:yes gene_type:complete